MNGLLFGGGAVVSILVLWAFLSLFNNGRYTAFSFIVLFNLYLILFIALLAWGAYYLREGIQRDHFGSIVMAVIMGLFSIGPAYMVVHLYRHLAERLDRN